MGIESESQYEANMAVLKEFQPKVWQYLVDNNPEPTGQIVVSPTGKLNLMVESENGPGGLLHDTADPEAEVPQFLQMIPEDSTGFVALVGMGLGYTPLAILQQRKSIRHLAVFDVHPGVFVQAMHHVDLAPMLSDRRLLLSITPHPNYEEVLAPAGRALLVEAIHTLKHVPSFVFDPEAYEKLSNKLFSLVNASNVGGATVFAFGDSFIDNRFSHLAVMPHNRLIDHLQGAFADIPAILVAGGPSLDKNIDLLTRVRSKAIIIAVDTVLPKLLKHGICPDFVTSIDMEEFTIEKMADAMPLLPADANISLICSSWVTPSVPKTFPASQVYWTFTPRPIEQWFNRFLGGTMTLPGANTVAHLSLQAALVMGCSPIVFTGQDLAFSENKDHADDTVLTNRNAMNTVFQSDDLVWVDGWMGGNVPTNRSFLSMKNFFEQIIDSQPGNYINATEGGAHIAGTTAVSLSEVIDTYCKEERFLSTHINTTGAPFVPMSHIIKELRSTLATVKSLKKIINKTDRMTSVVRKDLAKLRQAGARPTSFDKLPVFFQQKINQVHQGHNDLDATIHIWAMLEEITMEGLRANERYIHALSLIAADPKKYIDWIEKNLERLSAINTVRRRVLGVLEHHLVKVLNHLRLESQLLEKITKKHDDADAVTDLLRLYMDSENFVLAQRMLTPLPSFLADSAEVNFSLGVIAACRTEFEKAEQHFTQACVLDASHEGKVEEFKRKKGDTYLRHAIRLQRDGYDVGPMLLKGLRYCGNHDGIRRSLLILFDSDISRIENSIKAGDWDKYAPEVDFWCDSLSRHATLAALLPPEQQASLWRYQGQLRVRRGEFVGAAASLTEALSLTKDDPALHVQLADAFFAVENFVQGVAQLDEAVRLDNSCAQYWENMGDNLFQAGKPEDAVAAFERCLLAQPERIDLIKKIGDCYSATDQLEAALEAYRQYKAALEQAGPPQSGATH